MTDGRLGKPSASSFALDALCPGRQQLLSELGDIPEPVDEDADRGTRLHAAWRDAGTPQLHLFEDPEDTEIYERGVELVKKVQADWMLSVWPTGAFDTQTSVREERFYLHDSNGDVSASGQADRVDVWKTYALVCDFKALWCRSLVPAELNWQARLLSVLVAREYGATHVRFAFLKAMMNKSDIVDYNEEDLKRAEWSIQQVLWESRQNGAQRRPGPHCRRCKAVSGCPEGMSFAYMPSVQVQAPAEGVTPKVAVELVSNISLLDCAKIHTSKTARHNIEDACKARLKAQPEPDLAELGLMFGKPKVLRPITHTQAAFEFLLSVGVPADKLWRATTMSNGELAKVVQECLGLKSKKEAETWVRTKLAAWITELECDKPLEKI